MSKNSNRICRPLTTIATILTMLLGVLTACSATDAEMEEEPMVRNAGSQVRAAAGIDWSGPYDVTTTELWCERDGKRIYGELTLPTNALRVASRSSSIPTASAAPTPAARR